MSQMTWTTAQQAAIDARGQNLLLSAAAGSGKTAVLTERIKKLITDMDDPADITELLVLTFTRASAGEMKTRISSGIAKALSEAEQERNTPLARHLSRQLALMSSAQISTLDSFFQTLIRRYFYLIDLDPNTKMLTDSNEIYALEQDVLSEVLETYYEMGEPAFLDCADLLSGGFEDSGFKDTILSLYHFSCSMPFPGDWLGNLSRPYGENGAAALSDLPWTKDILEDFRRRAQSWADSYRQIFTFLENEPALAPYAETLSDEFDAFTILSKAETWDEWYQDAPNISFAKLKAVKKSSSEDPIRFEEIKNNVQAIRNSVKKEVSEKLLPFFAITEEQWLHDVIRMHPIVRALSDVTIAFSRAYAGRKKQEGLMEFTDMEHYVLDILVDKTAEGFTLERAGEFPSSAARELQKKYKEIMIDEYQDTNDVQELIATLLSNGRNRFMVGDVKQSIYRFRQADPTIFQKKYRSFSSDENAEDRRIDLNRNFRSDAAILASINYIFRQLMSEKLLELDYGDREALYPGRHEDPRPAAYAGGAVEVELIDKVTDENTVPMDESVNDITSITFEGRLIAKKIRVLMEEKRQVMNKDGTFRSIDYSDIVILLRSIDKKAPALLKVLNEEHIPATADKDDDFIRSMEVQILWSLLKILDNPRQDLPLLAVLRSFLAGLDEEDFARLRLALAPEEDSLWDILPRAGGIIPEEKALRLSRFLSLYETWRKEARKDGVAPLLRRIIEDTDYLSWVAGLPNGTVGKSHVLSFYELAKTRDSATVNGLFSFLEYLRRAQKDFKTISTSAKGNAVQIMSIHKSKGLEFPVVFLADAAKSFNVKDLDRTVIFHREMGLGIHYFDKEHMAHWPSLYWMAIRTAAGREAQAEEARLLYVAMTRARDLLCITAFRKNFIPYISSCLTPLSSLTEAESRLPAHITAGGKSYLSWILPAAARHRSAAYLWDTVGKIPSYLAPDINDSPSAFHFTITPWQELLTGEERRTEEINGEMDFEEWEEKKKQKEAKDIDNIKAFLTAPASDVPDWMEKQLRWQYSFNGSVQTPAKLTATAAVALKEQQESGAEGIEPFSSETLAPAMESIPSGEESSLLPGYEDPPAFLAETPAFTGTSYGTLMHKAMELIDLTRPYDGIPDLRKEVERIYENKGFTEEEKNALLQDSKYRAPLRDIRRFTESALGRSMKKAAVIRKEMPFSLLLPAKRFYPGCEEGEKVFMQGIMDCLIERDGHIVIIDYKTDRTDSVEELQSHYRSQLLVYKDAAEQLLGKPVIGAYLWSFHLGQMIAIK